MIKTKTGSHDEEMKKLIGQIAEVCLSEEFQSLRQELEMLYFNSGMENALVAAFQDALITMLAQREEVKPFKLRTY
ncbi:hypothetical protein FDZ73_24755 [bacterium]|nr:MAG: hypothetical protein FDZ73_24755 [bacterium]